MLGAPKALETDSIKKIKAICHLGVNGSEDVVMRATNNVYESQNPLKKKRWGSIAQMCSSCPLMPMLATAASGVVSSLSHTI